MDELNQQEINEAEWRNPENWNLAFYFSKKDSRVIVPKRIRAMGWTVNLGKRAGAAILIATIIVIPLLAILTLVILRTRR